MKIELEKILKNYIERKLKESPSPLSSIDLVTAFKSNILDIDKDSFLLCLDKVLKNNSFTYLTYHLDNSNLTYYIIFSPNSYNLQLNIK